MTASQGQRSFDYYRSGQFNGEGPVLYMFNFWRADGAYGSALCVEEGDVVKTRDALIQQGYVRREPPVTISRNRRNSPLRPSHSA